MHSDVLYRLILLKKLINRHKLTTLIRLIGQPTGSSPNVQFCSPGSEKMSADPGNFEWNSKKNNKIQKVKIDIFLNLIFPVKQLTENSNKILVNTCFVGFFDINRHYQR